MSTVDENEFSMKIWTFYVISRKNLFLVNWPDPFCDRWEVLSKMNFLCTSGHFIQFPAKKFNWPLTPVQSSVGKNEVSVKIQTFLWNRVNVLHLNCWNEWFFWLNELEFIKTFRWNSFLILIKFKSNSYVEINIIRKVELSLVSNWLDNVIKKLTDSKRKPKKM